MANSKPVVAELDDDEEEFSDETVIRARDEGQAFGGQCIAYIEDMTEINSARISHIGALLEDLEAG